MADLFVQAAFIAVYAFAFGVLLKLSDLLQEHGYKWFVGAGLAIGILATIPALLLLALADVHLRVFWVAVIFSWILRGRVDGINHGIPIVSMLCFLATAQIEASDHMWEFIYFFGLLSLLGLAHDFLQYHFSGGPKGLRWFFEKQHLYWYALGLGFLIWFEPNFVLFFALVGFVKGYGLLYQKGPLRLLSKLGIREPQLAKHGTPV